MRGLLGSCLLVSIALLSSSQMGCSPQKGPNGKGAGNTADPLTVDPGSPIFERVEYAAFSGDSAGDFIVVPAGHLTAPYRQEISSQVDGTIDWIGAEIPEADVSKYDKRDIYKHESAKKFYRRLQRGDLVNQDQIVVIFDENQARFEMLGVKAKLDGAKQSEKALDTVVKSLDKQLKKLQEGGDAVPRLEMFRLEAEVNRYISEYVTQIGIATSAKADLEKFEHKLTQHVLRSAITGEVVSINRNERESIRSTDLVMVVQDFSRLRAEGSVKIEYLSRIRKGDEVFFEVTRYQSASEVDTFAQHTPNRPIMAVAVAKVGEQHLIISSGEDGWVRVWDRNKKVLQSWKMPSNVRSLAVAKHEPTVLVPSDSGDLHLYDLSNLSKDPARKLEPKADGIVTAVALSPDGGWATIADERGIHLYDTRNGKRKYTLPSKAHHSQVTQLTITPQGRLISVGKEPSVLVWELGEKGARLEQRFDSRIGDVTAPAISDDGNRLYLDTDKTRLDVVHLGEARRERSLNLTSDGARFNTFSVLSPEVGTTKERLLLSAGASEGVVHLFKAPSTKERGSEVVRYVTKSNSPATAAAFSTDAKSKDAFFVVGTKKGDIHIWGLPQEAELNNEYKSRLTYLDKTTDSSGRTARISVDLENPKLPNGDYLFRPGSTTTLILKAR